MSPVLRDLTNPMELKSNSEPRLVKTHSKSFPVYQERWRRVWREPIPNLTQSEKLWTNRESQNSWGWKGALEVTCPIAPGWSGVSQSRLPRALSRQPEHLQAQKLSHVSGQPLQYLMTLNTKTGFSHVWTVFPVVPSNTIEQNYKCLQNKWSGWRWKMEPIRSSLDMSCILLPQSLMLCQPPDRMKPAVNEMQTTPVKPELFHFSL